MNAIHYIHLYTDNQLRAERLRSKADALTSSLDTVYNFLGDDLKVKSSPDPMRRSRLLAELADTRAELYREAGRLELIGLEVIGVVSKIEQPELARCLLYCGVLGMSDKEIEEKYGDKRLSSYWLEAIQALQKYIDDNGIDYPGSTSEIL